MERKGASYKITSYRNTPASDFGDWSGADYDIQSIQVNGKHHATVSRLEELPSGVHSGGVSHFTSGPYRTQRRAQIAGSALANRVSQGSDTAEPYRDYARDRKEIR